MDQDTINYYKDAGEIAAKSLLYGKSLIKKGANVKDILDKIESKIIELGGKIAFPAQISLNEVAAHACPDLNDKTILQDQIVKLDVGAHVNGFIGDNALTVDLSGNYKELLKANQEALDAALRIVAPNLPLKEIGKTIHEVITSYGYSPIKNLSGHGLGKFQIHTTPSIPNFDNGNENVLEEGMAIAIEPFASTGSGIVKEKFPSSVFTLLNESGIRDPITRKVLAELKTYEGLPFAKRWIEKKFGSVKSNFALRQLKNKRCILEHPPLVDTKKGIVSQFEHSIIVLEKPIITTKI